MTTLPVSPMLLHSTDAPPVSPDWIHQVKFDGVRCVLANPDGTIHLWSRHGTPCTRQFPEFQSLRLPPSVILDGELIVVSSGWTDFEAVMERFMSHKQDKIVRLASTTPAHFVAFDILNINGDNVMSRPLRERQALLSSVVEPRDVISVCQSFADGQALFESTRQLGWEGVVSKRLESLYPPTLCESWAADQTEEVRTSKMGANMVKAQTVRWYNRGIMKGAQIMNANNLIDWLGFTGLCLLIIGVLTARRILYRGSLTRRDRTQELTEMLKEIRDEIKDGNSEPREPDRTHL